MWRKEGLDGIFSSEQEFEFSPVTRHTAGLYSCTGENQLGLSKPDYVEVDVKCKFYYLIYVKLPHTLVFLECKSVKINILLCSSYLFF